jgi:hypothetical protein
MTERDEPLTPDEFAAEPADFLDTEPSMTQHPDPTADPLSDPTGEPLAPATPSADPVGDPTTTIETQHTQAVPAATPFRVEPASPVPDDVTTEPAGDLGETPQQAPSNPSHLPPPAPQAWGAPPVAHPTSARVTVRKGPRPGAVVLGLLAMLVSAYVIAVNVSDASLEFRIVGPALIGALGGLLLLVGLAGVLIGRLRR